MRPSLLVLYALVVAAPLAIAGWLGVHYARTTQAMAAENYLEAVSRELAAISENVASVLEDRERDLANIGELSDASPESIRARVRRSPWIQNALVLTDDARLHHPDANTDLSRNEMDFLDRTAAIRANGAIGSTVSEDGSRQDAGWYTWYEGDGRNFVYWQRSESGRIVGAELIRARLVADIVAALPDSRVSDNPAGYSLVSSTGQTLYRWGGFVPNPDAAAQRAHALAEPLGGWYLEYHWDPNWAESEFGGGFTAAALLALGLAGFAFIALSVYLYREQARDLREAAQRVNFVNQVSHELKTPLTNIRMYAELLEQRVDPEDPKARKHLSVIVDESRRLSRLIANVLTFGRARREAIALQRVEAEVGEILVGVLETFTPALDRRGISIACDTNVSGTRLVDRDILEQIAGNLLSNVEKYARDATQVSLVAESEGDLVRITLTDDGPGIAARDRDNVFEPFYRASDKLTDGVAGTGIGLTISRELAKLHGGDLRLAPTERGAQFVLTIEAPPVQGGVEA